MIILYIYYTYIILIVKLKIRIIQILFKPKIKAKFEGFFKPDFPKNKSDGN